VRDTTINGDRQIYIYGSESSQAVPARPSSKYILKRRCDLILKGSADGVLHLEESCFWTFSIV
jgi:hypothetical protein